MDPNNTISGSSTARHRNARAFRWRADDGPTLNSEFGSFVILRGSGPVLLRNPIFK